jgi:RND family efflux transporter MFP subunit
MIAAGWLGYFLYAKNNVQAAAQSKPAHTPQRVMVIHPQSATRTAPFVYNVRVKPIEEAEIFARADGFVEERLVDIGDTVKAGQLLARLSSPELEEGIKQVKADIKRQEAVAVLAKQQLKRAEALKDIGGVSRSEFDERTSDNHVAIATLATLKARLDQLQSEYGYTRIIAPFNGRITVRNIDRGDRVGSDDSTHARPLFRIVRDDTLRVIADVPQTQIYAIDTNGSAQFVLTEIPGKTFELVYDRSSHEVDPKLGSMRMEFLLDNRDGKLPSGLSGEIRIAPAKKRDYPHRS